MNEPTHFGMVAIGAASPNMARANSITKQVA